SAAAQQPAHGAHELVGALALLRLRGTDDAVVRVIVQQPERDLVQRRLDGRDLGEDVDAIAVLLDHALDAADLALDAAQAGQELVLGGGIAASLGGGHEISIAYGAGV